MTNVERALRSYFSETRHCASIGNTNKALHARRSALLTRGKVNQAVAVRRTHQLSDADPQPEKVRQRPWIDRNR